MKLPIEMSWVLSINLILCINNNRNLNIMIESAWNSSSEKLIFVNQIIT